MSLFGFGSQKNQKSKQAKKSKKSKPREIWQGKSHGLDDIISPSVLVGGGENSPEPFLVDLPPVSGSEIDLLQSDLLQALEAGNLDVLLQPPDDYLLNPQTIIDWLNDPTSQPLSFFNNPVASTNSLPESTSILHSSNSCPVENGESLSGKELPGNTTFPGATPPTIPVTNVDTGGNSLGNATSIIRSDIQDVIDQVSGIDPTDIYRANINDLKNADISVLSGQISVDYLMPSGQLIGSQFFSTGNHTLLPPANITGDVVVKINYQGGTPGTYILNGFETKNHSEPFNIDLEFGGGLSASQQAIIQAAAKSVESIISQGLPTAIVDGKLIDDVNFKISATNLDGAGGTAARTKIDFMRFGTMLPAQSITQFDAADIAELERSGELFSVVQHELLHGLGFGNLWEAKGLVDYAGTPLAQYNGQKAVKAFQELGGLTSHINLENNGNGSAGLHWNENIFQDEVMTADYNNGKDGNAPISLVTIASLADLGYQVNLNRATPDYGLFGGQKFNTNDLTPEELEAFRELAETSFTNSDEEFIYATMPEVDPDTVAPEIWAHAERFWKNGEYYEWREIIIGDWRNGHTISGYVYDYMTNHPSNDNRSRGAKANDPAYWAFISNKNGYPDPNWIVKGEIAKVPIWKENYEQQQEAKRLADLARLQEEQRQEAERQKQAQEKLKNDLAEQEKLKKDQERLQQEAAAKQKELEEQAQKLAEDLKRRQQQEWEQQQARLKEIERQKGLGGEDWYLAKSLPEFGPVDPFQTKLTGETVGNLVPDDYYRFTLSRSGRITAELRQLLADADMVLYDVRNRPISYSMRDGITDEHLIADLIPGTYLIRVNSPKGVTTDYELIVKFKHKLSQSEIGPPPGWRVGGGTGGGTGGGGGNAGPIFSDPRIESIYKNALNIFSNAERAKANARIQQLEREKKGYQQDLQKLLDQMNGEQRAKVHGALDDARHDANVWVDNIANPIKNTVNSLADGIINKANEFANTLENQVNQIPDWGHQWIRDRKDEAKRFIRQGRDAVTSAVNSSRSWLTGKLQQIQDGVKSAIWHFFETIKNAYRTGGEINQIIANAAQSFRNTVDQAVRGANDLIAGFKGKVLSDAKWTENMGINIDQFGIKVNFNAYNNIVKPAVDAVADGYNSVIGGIGNTLKGIVNWIEPRTQKVVADIVNAVFGDKTGYLWNEIHEVDAKIAATRTGLERAIINAGTLILGVVRQIEAFLTDPEERKRVLDALFQRGYQTAEEAYDFVVKKAEEIRRQEAEEKARQEAEEKARQEAEEKARQEDKRVRETLDEALAFIEKIEKENSGKSVHEIANILRGHTRDEYITGQWTLFTNLSNSGNLGSELSSNSLALSQQQTDFGHFIASLSDQIMHPNQIANATGDWSSWAGDIGSAPVEYKKNPGKYTNLKEALDKFAPASDYSADIAAYIVGDMINSNNRTGSVSDAIQQYNNTLYLDHVRTFITKRLGGIIEGRTLTNPSVVESVIRRSVASFIPPYATVRQSLNWPNGDDVFEGSMHFLSYLENQGGLLIPNFQPYPNSLTDPLLSEISKSINTSISDAQNDFEKRANDFGNALIDWAYPFNNLP